MPSELDIINAALPPTERQVKFNGKPTPGLSYPTGAGSPRKWDKQGGYGTSGATLIYNGNDLSEFDVIVDIWEDSHWAQWAAFAPVVEKAPVGKRAKAIEIEHSLVNRSPIKITKVVVTDCSQFERVGDTGLWSCRIKVMDARVALPALGKPDGIPGVDPKKPTPDAVIDPLLSKVDELHARLNASQKAGSL